MYANTAREAVINLIYLHVEHDFRTSGVERLQILRGRFQYALRAAYRDHTGRGVQAYKSQFEQRPQRVQYLVHFRGGSSSGNAIRTHAHAVVQAIILGSAQGDGPRLSVAREGELLGHRTA